MKDQKLTTIVFSDADKKYADKFMNFDTYHYTFDKFLEAVQNDQARILDAACGPGKISQYLLSKNAGLKIKGIDLAEGMTEIAKEQIPQAEFEVKSILNFTGKYDGIICGFGLPYLSKEEVIAFIQLCESSLNKNGILYLSTMEGDYKKSDFQAQSSGVGSSLFIHYYRASFLKSLLEKNNFSVILEDRKMDQHNAEKTFTDLILIGKKLN